MALGLAGGGTTPPLYPAGSVNPDYGHWHAHRRTFPIASEPSAMPARNPARNHRRAPDQPSEGCGRGEGRLSDGADGRGGFPLHRTGERVQHLPVVAAGCQLAEKMSNYLTLAYG